MTNTTTVVESGVQGDLEYAIVDVNITSLALAGAEAFDADGILGIDTLGASVVEQENGGYHITWDNAGNIVVKYADYDAAADGVLIDVPSATDVGVVRLHFVGR